MAHWRRCHIATPTLTLTGSAFLYHAIRAGMDMGIVNAGALPIYDDIPAGACACVCMRVYVCSWCVVLSMWQTSSSWWRMPF